MTSGLTKSSKLFAAGLILILIIVHHDFWNWGVTERSLGGLPRGFVFQVGLSIAVALVWWIVTLVAWPKDDWADADDIKQQQTKIASAKTPSKSPGAKA